MEIRFDKGHWIVVGHIFATSSIRVGQLWMGASGAIVEVLSVDSRGWVKYSQQNGPDCEKDLFSVIGG